MLALSSKGYIPLYAIFSFNIILAPITHTRYENLLVRINQAIGHIPIGKIQTMHLQMFYNNLREVISEKTKQPLSPQTIKHYHRCIAAILASATKEQIIPRNVASREFMDAPKINKKEPPHLNDVEAKLFVSLLMQEQDLRKKSALMLLTYSGCRIGELCGLEWSDIHFEQRIISIERCSQYCKGYGIITKEPKNETSKRTLSLPAVVFGVLAEYKDWYQEQILLLGDRWQNSNRLFVQEDGRPIQPATINQWLNKFTVAHNLPKITPHSLRHTNIMLLITNKVDVRTVAQKSHILLTGYFPENLSMTANI